MILASHTNNNREERQRSQQRRSLFLSLETTRDDDNNNKEASWGLLAWGQRSLLLWGWCVPPLFIYSILYIYTRA